MRIIVLAVGAIMKDIRKYWLFSGRNAAVTSFSMHIIITNLNYNIHMYINIYGKYGLRWITFWSIKPFYLKRFRFLDKEIVTLSVKKSPKDINTYGKSDKASYSKLSNNLANAASKMSRNRNTTSNSAKSRWCFGGSFALITVVWFTMNSLHCFEVSIWSNSS